MTKISQLPTGTTLDGTEMVPIVQQGITVEVPAASFSAPGGITPVAQGGTGASTAAAALANLQYLTALSGGVARSATAKNGDWVSVKDFGAVGDGVTDDTAAINTCIAAVNASPYRAVYFPAGTYKITSALAVTAPAFYAFGAGMNGTILKASGNFSAVFTFSLAVLQLRVSAMTIDQTGTTTQCVNLALNNSGGNYPLDFDFVQFKGDMNSTAGSLVYCGGVLGQFHSCVWTPNYASMVSLQLDGLNANTSVVNCVILGTGNGINFTKTGGATLGPNGVRIQDCILACFSAAYCIQVGGAALNTWITGCVCDQASTGVIRINSAAAATTITNGYAGTAASGTGQAIIMDATVAVVQISDMQIFGGNICILIGGSVSTRAQQIQITGCEFSGATAATIQADSVNGMILFNNLDTSSCQSLTTLGTNASKGSYVLGGNIWSSSACTLDASSSYRDDGTSRGGLVLNTRFNVTSGAATTSVVITHGLSLTPSNVIVTPVGSNPGTYWVSGITSTQFTINWTTAGAQTWHWQAQNYS
jgi:hypothetical protein